MAGSVTQRFSVRGGLVVVLPVMALLTAAGCGDVNINSGAGGGAFTGECSVSRPDFPFCGANLVRCTDQTKTLYQVFNESCPPGWTVVPPGVAFPNLACTDPQGRTFNVDADQCPPGWTEFTLNL